jgi:hypothetical protein
MVANPPPKFPDMRPPPGAASQVRGLPTPAGYRRSMPLIGAPEPDARAPRGERKRLMFWFGLAVSLHAVLLLVIWLMPPLRLKWSPSPQDWVTVVSIPATATHPTENTHKAFVTPPPRQTRRRVESPATP